MFNWFWNFLYSISNILFQIIDGLFKIANKLCGIEPITVAGKDTDFMVFLLTNEKVTYGFAGAVLISIFLLMLFGTFAICRACKDGKKTPGQVAVQVIKILLLYMCVPAIMVIFTILVNNLVRILYDATRVGEQSIGDFLFRSFLPDEMQDDVFDINWTKVEQVRSLMSSAGYGLSKYKFFFSWIVCIPLVLIFARAVFLFVERCLSVVMLYIISPIVMSSAVLDDGQHFKKWRDQILGKFLGGFGMIIGVNLYILSLSLILRSEVKFFDNNFLNFLFKMTFTLGGAFFLTKVFTLIGSLVDPGMANDVQSAMAAGTGIGKMYGKVLKKAKKLGKSIKDEGKDDEEEEGGEQDSTKGGIGLNGGGPGAQGGGSGNQNKKKNKSDSEKHKAVAGALAGLAFAPMMFAVDAANMAAGGKDDDKDDDDKDKKKKGSGNGNHADTTQNLNLQMAVANTAKKEAEKKK